MKKINPLIITAIFAIVGVYVGVIKIAGAGIERIAEILMAAFTVDTAIDIVCSVLIVSVGFFCVYPYRGSRHICYRAVY